MVDELDLSVLGTSCKYSGTKAGYNPNRAANKGYNLLTSYMSYYTHGQPELTSEPITLVKKTDQTGGDNSNGSNSHSNQDSKPTTARRSENKRKPQTGENNEDYKPKITLAGHVDPTYYIGGGNGNAIIEDIMNDLGWRRIKDKLDDSYTLKWCEVKQTINYNTFKEGDQMVNHIPNCNLLTNKLGLLNSLQEYSRVCGAMKKRVPKLDFIPETFRLDDPREREVFREKWKEDEVWICKPTGRNQGKGIFLVKNKEEFDQLLQESDDRNRQQQQGKSSKPMNRIIQRYIHNPLLLNSKKFDIRAYMLVGSTVPFLVLYHKGYIRLSMFEYENKYDNLAMHLTNQFIQKKEAIYKDMKEDTVWSMERFNDYINENVKEDQAIETDWADTVLPDRMKQIMTYCFNAVKHRLHSKTGYFDLYGFDFMIDTDMKVWLIEVNVNPCLATNCEVLKGVVPSIIKETLYIAIDCFEKARKGKAVLPCPSINNFELLFHGGGNGSKTSRSSSPVRQNRSGSISPVRRPRTISPTKEIAHQAGDNYPQNRHGFMHMRPGMKPSPTNLYGSRPTGSMLTSQTNVGSRPTGSMLTSQTNVGSRPTGSMLASQTNVGSRTLNATSQAKFAYTQEKGFTSRSLVRASSDKTQPQGRHEKPKDGQSARGAPKVDQVQKVEQIKEESLEEKPSPKVKQPTGDGSEKLGKASKPSKVDMLEKPVKPGQLSAGDVGEKPARTVKQPVGEKPAQVRVSDCDKSPKVVPKSEARSQKLELVKPVVGSSSPNVQSRSPKIQIKSETKSQSGQHEKGDPSRTSENLSSKERSGAAKATGKLTKVPKTSSSIEKNTKPVTSESNTSNKNNAGKTMGRESTSTDAGVPSTSVKKNTKSGENKDKEIRGS